MSFFSTNIEANTAWMGRVHQKWPELKLERCCGKWQEKNFLDNENKQRSWYGKEPAMV